MIRIPTSYQPLLLSSEEYGMGFQIGTIMFSSYKTERGIILNGSILCPITEFQSLKNVAAEYEYALRTAKTRTDIIKIDLEKRNPRGIRRIPKAAFDSARSYSIKSESTEAPAKDAQITITALNEIFKRFSAYEKDFRVTARLGLTPGTYATTEEDAKHIATGLEAVARYALENKMSANNVFTIGPKEKTKLKRGTVEPAYGEPGGGVEVIFVNGTDDYTVTGPVKIPEN